MQKSYTSAENMAEKLHDLNPNLNVRVDHTNNQVVATIAKLNLNGEQLKALGEIVEDNTVSFDRSGDKFRMKIH